MNISLEDQAIIDTVAQNATIVWNQNLSNKNAKVPEILVGVHRPETFPKTLPTEIFITASDSDPLFFFCTPTQIYATHPLRATKHRTQNGTPFYFLKQGDQDRMLYGHRSPLRALICDIKSMGSFVDPRITFALKYIAPNVLKDVKGVVI